MKKITFIIFTIICFLTLNVKAFQKTGFFSVTGYINNKSDTRLILSYLDAKGKSINDTTVSTNGSFIFKGYINEPTLAYLMGNVKNGSIDDPNFTEIYLEPNKMTVSITENNFKYLKVTSSKTQDELESLREIQKPILIKLDTLNINFGKLRRAYTNGDKSDSTSKKISILRAELLTYLNQINKMSFSFVINNPNSYASAGLLGTKLNINSLPVDSAKFYYYGLNPKIQSSFWGRKINEGITSKENSSINKIAPIFSLNDINGNKITLADYKDKKYVLLDFWASWCIPCRESTPEIKKLYEKYQTKGLEIISVSIDDNEKSWRTAVLKDQIPWRNVLVGSKPAPLSLKTLYNIIPVPSYVLIDKNGKIIGRPQSINEINDKESLTQLLENIFN